MWTALLSRKKCVILQAQWKNVVFLHRPNWIHKVICCGIYEAVFYPTWSLIFVIYDTPKVAIFWALTRYVNSEHSLYTKVGVAFLCFWNIWIQSGSTMWLCHEPLTIIVIALVNQFVHGRVPTAATCCMGWGFHHLILVNKHRLHRNFPWQVCFQHETSMICCKFNSVSGISTKFTRFYVLSYTCNSRHCCWI